MTRRTGSNEFNNDHDALITLIAEVRNLTVEFKDLKENLAARLERVEVAKLAATDFVNYKTEVALVQQDHETRTRMIEKFVENWKGKNAILATVVMFVIGLIGSLITKYVL